MTFLSAFLISLGILGLCNLAALYLLIRMRRRRAQVVKSAKYFVKECLYLFPFMRNWAVHGYGLMPRALPRVRAKYLKHLCQSLLTQEYCQTAVEKCSRVLRRNPSARDYYIIRGSALRRIGREVEAMADFQSAHALPAKIGEESSSLYHQLSQHMLKRGNLGASLFFSWARLEVDHGIAGPIPFSPVPSDEEFHAALCSLSSYHFQLLLEAHCDVAEEVINTESNFDLALEIYSRREILQQKYRETFGLEHLRTLYLTHDWVRNIGHIALLDFLVKMNHLGWSAWDNIVVLAPPSTVANASLLECLKKHIAIVSDQHLITGLTPLAQAMGRRVAGILELPNGQTEYFCDAMGVIQEAWEKQDRPPLLAISEQDQVEKRGRQCLREMGVPEGAWFVVLHVRSPGFHREGSYPQQAHRNADIKSYSPAIDEIIERGGWVIRLGDPSMEPLPPRHGLIDYAHSRFKSDWMDVFLIANSRFFLGVASGLCSVPCTFGVPSLMTNWISNHLPVYGRRDLFIPKLCWSDRERRFLTFDEFYPVEVRRLGYSREDLAREGLRVMENSPEEIRAAVEEMFDLLDGKDHADATDQAMQESFRTIADRHGLRGYSRIGREFLRTHADLLRTVPAGPQSGDAAESTTSDSDDRSRLRAG